MWTKASFLGDEQYVFQGEKCNDWIKLCMYIVHFSMLVDRIPIGIFQSSRGPRQGDHLSPYLFILVLGVLFRNMDRVVDTGFINNFKLKGRE